MAYSTVQNLLPHLHSGWEVDSIDQAIASDASEVILIPHALLAVHCVHCLLIDSVRSYSIRFDIIIIVIAIVIAFVVFPGWAGHRVSFLCFQ